MDAYLILKTIANKKQQIEKLESKDINPNFMNMGTILSVIIGAYAAYISYTCNTRKNVPEIHKIIFAVSAYIFGFLYLIYYYLFRYDTCEL
jgi:hypothetical protein